MEHLRIPGAQRCEQYFHLWRYLVSATDQWKWIQLKQNWSTESAGSRTSYCVHRIGKISTHDANNYVTVMSPFNYLIFRIWAERDSTGSLCNSPSQELHCHMLLPPQTHSKPSCQKSAFTTTPLYIYPCCMPTFSMNLVILVLKGNIPGLPFCLCSASGNCLEMRRGIRMSYPASRNGDDGTD